MSTVGYFAGFFDADGWVSIRRGKERSGAQAFSVQVGVAQNTTEVLTVYQQRFGGSIRLQEAETGVYHWRAYGKEAELFLRAVAPHVVVKRERVMLALEFRALIGIGGPRKPDAANLARREMYWRQMRDLNATRAIRQRLAVLSAA